MTNDFCYFLRVRYSECDAQQVVFNAIYADYVDIAVAEYTRVVWGAYKNIVESGIDNQVVSYTINWRAPARFDEVLAITVKPSKIGNSSYSFQVDFYNSENQSMIASAEIVYVMVSTVGHEKMLIPEAMRKKLEVGAQGITVDHAGGMNNA